MRNRPDRGDALFREHSGRSVKVRECKMVGKTEEKQREREIVEWRSVMKDQAEVE